jgi:hypothetical protein
VYGKINKEHIRVNLMMDNSLVELFYITMAEYIKVISQKEKDMAYIVNLRMLMEINLSVNLKEII